MWRSGRLTGIVMLVGSIASAAEERAAILEYLTPVVAEFSRDTNGGWLWEHDANGGYLIRRSMDVTGDGRPEVFVTSTLTSVKYMGEWQVFDLSENGKWRPYAPKIRFWLGSAWPFNVGEAPSLIHIGAPDQEKLRVSDERPYPVRRYTFSYPAITDAWTYASESEVAALTPSDGTKLPKLEGILLADYLMDPEAKWSDMTGWGIDAGDYFFREADREKVSKHRDFTPAVAMERLSGERESGRREGDNPTPQRSEHKGGREIDMPGDRGSAGVGTAKLWIGGVAAMLLAVGAIGAVWWQRRKHR